MVSGLGSGQGTEIDLGARAVVANRFTLSIQPEEALGALLAARVLDGPAKDAATLATARGIAGAPDLKVTRPPPGFVLAGALALVHGREVQVN